MLMDAIGVAAGIAVIAAFYARCPIRLRVFALLSNVLFVAYGLCTGLLPVILLHLLLVPLNLQRLFAAQALSGK